MDSWWSLGEYSGYPGNTLAVYRIACPFCEEEGNFRNAFHAEKKKANNSKTLNFDTLECGNCKGNVMVLWSASSSHSHTSGGLHDYKVLPWPLKLKKWPSDWPDSVGRYWLQAKRSLTAENWDAAALMARSALQCALRDQNATGKSLKAEIDDLSSKGLLPPIMKEWAHNLRELGNESAHPDPNAAQTSSGDATDIIQFLDYLLEYLYTLPKQIESYRKRRAPKAATQVQQD
jgi:hypothetical protein